MLGWVIRRRVWLWTGWQLAPEPDKMVRRSLVRCDNAVNFLTAKDRKIGPAGEILDSIKHLVVKIPAQSFSWIEIGKKICLEFARCTEQTRQSRAAALGREESVLLRHRVVRIGDAAEDLEDLCPGFTRLQRVVVMFTLVAVPWAFQPKF